MKIIINMSRVGVKNTGLARFSAATCQYFSNVACGEVICQSGHAVPLNFAGTYVPTWLGISSKISFIKPIVWFIYSWIKLQRYGNYVISLTHHVLPRSPKQIAVVHDIRPLYFPDSKIQFVYFKYLLPLALRRISATVTVSEASRQKLITEYSLDPDKVFIVPNVVRLPAISQSQSTINEPYLLMVGATWAHKNAHEVIEMADHWKSKYRLIILAGEGSYKTHLKVLAHQRHLLDRIDFLDFVPDSELANLLGHASALVYPSLDEGFGIPPLEALSLGVPVIASDIPVLREVIGEAGIFVTLGQSDSWQSAFSLLDDPTAIHNKLARVPAIFERYSSQRFSAAWQAVLSKVWPELIPDRLHIDD